MRIRHSAKAAFTLVEIMIVVAIIGLLAAVAIPNLVKARKDAQKAACINNLKTIQGAKEVWALEMKKTDADTPTDGDLFGVDKNIREKPSCPAGGTYTLGPVSENPPAPWPATPCSLDVSQPGAAATGSRNPQRVLEPRSRAAPG